MNQAILTLKGLQQKLNKALQNGALEASFKEAFCEFYYDKVFSIAKNFSNDVHDAKDITQEFFFRIVYQQSLQELKPILFGTPNKWIYVVIKHLFFDYQKSKKRRKVVPLENIIEPRASNFHSINNLKELGLLSFSCSMIKIILLLRAFGYTFKEVAFELDITEGQAKMMVKRWRDSQN